ncbi:conserved hypothetical protein [Talaromyces stipitatus ATCC 10500]|uniref:Uncharacterized protein n=1 Tax=Talaromyces stipitatus (strain ATCC 10500 / CBS 375.48 / QM 6759 / NRRL 1006) TaxID=441959 RepID=B8M6X6_TALSN|nr:uncharacterized protein TSTA_034350 [Talaromyces stipitatus ATCC 10500]EED20196.1 conserved hypothetical protein [Talaromyces stipitatus ATCC 10500]
MDEQSSSSKPQPKGIAGSDGSAMPYILEHYMLNPTSYEIPLRSLYALNCQTLPLSPGANFRESNFANPPMQNSTQPLADAASQFKAQLISHISKGPHQYNLPVGFTISFVRRVFAETLEHVDFPQALTALDYLNNLESRRKKEILAAFESLGVELSTSPSLTIRASEVYKQDLKQTYPGVVRWIESIEAKERDAVAIYRKLRLSLRRWTLINELWLEPFDKIACMSMLNTLFNFQAQDSKAPKPEFDYDDKVETARQRQLFFENIRTLEKHGKVALENLLKSGARPGDETAWPLVHGFLKKFLNLADDTIHECTRVKDRDYLEAELRSKTHRRNADSGVSFTSSMNESFSSANSRAVTPSEKSRSPTPDSRPGKSTLERISNQLRKIRSRPDIKETTKIKPALSKKKSLSALVSRRSASSSSNETNFDVDEMRRQKMIWEAKQRKKVQAEVQATEDGRGTPQLGYAV